MRKLSLPFHQLFVASLSIILLSPPGLSWQSIIAAQKPAATLTTEEREAASRLKAETIREVTTILASKEMAERGTAQPGSDRRVKYLADKFAKIGLKPLGDAGTYLQAVKLKFEQVSPDSSLTVGETSFKFKDDFFVYDDPRTLMPAAPADVRAGLVFVSYGLVSPDLKRDDLAGMEVKGKIVVMLDSKPKNIDAATWAKSAGQRRALIQEAAGFIFIVVDPGNSILKPGSSFYSSMTSSFPSRRVSLADVPLTSAKLPPVLGVNDSTAEKLLAGSGITLEQAKQKAEAGEFVSRDLGKQASISIRVKREDGNISNVVGVIGGSDAALKEQAVVYSAHYDSHGIDPARELPPGSADGALSVGKLLAIAEALAKSEPKPRRSLIFLAVTGEEHRLLGTEYWVHHPTWPIEKVAANINFGGPGMDVWGPLKCIIDHGFKHSNLDDVIEGVAAASNITVLPDPFPHQQIQYRSGDFYRASHYAFIKKGVPAFYLVGGPGNDREEMRENIMRRWGLSVGDTAIRPDWNWDGARMLAAIALIAGMRIANQEVMPAWVPASPYNRPRGTDLPPPPHVQ